MFNDFDKNQLPSDLLIELSDQDQETLTGGCGFGGFNYFFFQQTDIDTFANQDISVSGGQSGGSGSSSSNTGYRLSQTTLAFGSFSPGRSSGLGSSAWRWGSSMWGPVLRPSWADG